MSKPNDYDTYIIPPNFIEGGTFFGGLLKLRNTAEALVIVLAIGIPVFSVSALTLTAKIIILCLTALPRAGGHQRRKSFVVHLPCPEIPP